MIHTTHAKAIEAYNALKRNLHLKLRSTDSRKQMMLKLELDKEAKFHDSEIVKLLERYNPTQLANGEFQFDSVEDKLEFDNAYKELQNMEVDIDAEPVNVLLYTYPQKAIDEIFISGEDQYSMLGFFELISEPPKEEVK